MDQVPQAQPTPYGREQINAEQLRTPTTIRHIEIDGLNSGFNIKVGCHTFAFETAEKMLKYLTMYLKNPSETENKFFSKEIDLTQ